MTTKKKITVTGTRTSAASKASAGGRVAVRVAEAEPVSPSAKQLQIWEQAVGLFTQRRFAEARDRFRDAAAGPQSHISDKARSYLQICERKIAKPNVEFGTSEEHFNYGVERLNARDIEQARFHFGRALGLEPDGDHIFYTMALCCGLAGDGNGACENLKRAIELEPRNRILARQDPEFTAIAGQLPALRTLLGADGQSW